MTDEEYGPEPMPAEDMRHGAGSPPPWVRLGQVRCGRMEGGRFVVERTAMASELERGRKRWSAPKPKTHGGGARKRAVVVGGEEYGSMAEAALALGAHPASVRAWASKGETPGGTPIRFAEPGERSQG